MLLYTAVVMANARAILYDPVLARRYSDNATPPPQSMRIPVSAKALAHTLHLPLSTVRRHLEALMEDNRIVRVAGGLLATDAALVDPRFPGIKHHAWPPDGSGAGKARHARLSVRRPS